MTDSPTAHVDTFARDNLPPSSQWPEFRFDLPELNYPAHLNAGALLDRAIENGWRDRPAVAAADATWTYGELNDTANRIARVLGSDLGLVTGNRVLLHAANSAIMVAAWFGILKAGGIVVATMPMLRPAELEIVIGAARITHALCDASFKKDVQTAAKSARALEQVASFDELTALAKAKPPRDFTAVPTSKDDVALIAFTSGTTGKPKGCVHFHRDVMAMADSFSRHVLKPEAGDVFCATPPIAFTFGLGGSVVFPLAVGASTVFPKKPGYDELCRTIKEHRVTTLFTAPTAYRAMLKMDAVDLSSLRTCVSAGEPLPRATSDAWFEKTGIRIIDGIGATEMIHIFISASGEDIRAGSTGKPLPGYRACVLDEAGQELPRGSTGRLAVTGPTGCRYLDDPRQLDYVKNGWNVTGDIYRVDDDGYFWFVSRADDMIVAAGYNIAGPEVEWALLAHPAVRECAVIGASDADRGTVVKACIVLAAGRAGDAALVKELQDFVKQRIAPYKYPRVIEFLEALPKTATGKLQRKALRGP